MPTRIFFCYAHEDESLLNRLQVHLSPLQRQGLIDVWHDRDISAGVNWEQEINEHLNNADIILLLVSPDFMASDYCYSIEMMRALERHEKGEAHVIPLILRPVYWQEVLGKLQALPTDGKPVTDSAWHNLDSAFLDITIGIRNLLAKMTEPRPIVALSRSSKEQSHDRRMDTGKLPALESLYIKSLCPYCIEWFYLGDCEIVSGKEPDVILKPLPSGWKRYAARVRPESLNKPAYRGHLARRRCPHCRHLLPYDIERAGNINIVIIGSGVATGKSHYIAALVHQLLSTPFGNVQFHTESLDIEENFMDKYFNSTLRNNNYNPSKKYFDILHPLMYEMTVLSNSNLPREYKYMKLRMYDIAVENIADPNSVQTKCLLNASAIIFIVDPMTMPNIVNQLPFHLRALAINDQRPSSALKTVIQAYEYDQRLQTGIQLSVPIAITLSKSDLLSFINHQYLFLHNPTRDDMPNLRDFQVINEEVSTLLYEFGDHGLFETNRTFSNVSFFATSATGLPSPKDETFPFMPIRCLDPLSWILWKLQIVELR